MVVVAVVSGGCDGCSHVSGLGTRQVRPVITGTPSQSVSYSVLPTLLLSPADWECQPSLLHCNNTQTSQEIIRERAGPFIRKDCDSSVWEEMKKCLGLTVLCGPARPSSPELL